MVIWPIGACAEDEAGETPEVASCKWLAERPARTDRPRTDATGQN